VSTLYNEIEPYAADWLERLIIAGHITGGTVGVRATPPRAGVLRGAGNAIVPQVAATFIRAALGGVA
jgi:hypothetical protein